MATAKTYEPKCLNFENWPDHHQAAWMKALQKVDLFGEGGGGAHWRERSREKTRKGYGFWLYWNLCRGIDISLMPASDIVTQESVLAYVADLEAINSSMTVSCRIQELYDAIRVMFPPRRGGEDWRWLRTAMKNLHMNARSSKISEIAYSRPIRLKNLGWI